MTTEIDALFDRLKGGSFDADPNSIPQEGAIGQGTIQGAGFIQSGGVPWAPFGNIDPGGTKSGVSQAIALNESRLMPIHIPALMAASKLVMFAGCLIGTSVNFDFVLLADDGQSNALTCVISEALSQATGVVAQHVYTFAGTTVVPAGMYWAMLRAKSAGGATLDVAYLTPIGSRSFGRTGMANSPAVGDVYLITGADWTISAELIFQAALIGTALGGL